MSSQQFKIFELKPFINKAIEKAGYKEPTEIQQLIIPIALNGDSAIGQSQTGTGKTLAYLLPILESINPNKDEVQAVITAPTRELAQQIFTEAMKLAEFSEEEITGKLFIGGTDKQRSIEKLKKQPHLVVGTPGRIKDLVNEQALNVFSANMLVVDEADLMLDMGFIHDVDQIAGRMPKDLQILVFSATIPEKLKPFLNKYMENPEYANVQPKQATAANIEHILIPKRSREKVAVVETILSGINPYLAIIFTNTKVKADEVAAALSKRGIKVGRLHGGLTPRERTKEMKAIRNLEYQYIVATDLAARGIDIDGVSHIINYELPQDLDFYIHRVGRTARAGLTGVAFTIYEVSDEDALNRLESRGIEFLHQDYRLGEWITLPARNKRKNKKKTRR